MDHMFLGVIVDGSTSFVPGKSYPIDYDSSHIEVGEEQEDQQTPVNIGTKRASNTGTTASSPSKKSKSPAVRAMYSNMRDFNQIQINRNMMMQTICDKRQQAI